jgi:hypothetical protein
MDRKAQRWVWTDHKADPQWQQPAPWGAWELGCLPLSVPNRLYWPHLYVPWLWLPWSVSTFGPGSNLWLRWSLRGLGADGGLLTRLPAAGSKLSLEGARG